MPKLIIITGTPGTGKSTLAKALAKKYGWERINLHHHYKELAVGYNRAKQCYDIDIKKLTAFITNKKKSTTKTLILDTHISHLLPKKLVDLCIVLTCSDLKKLKGRLQKRKYSKAKVQENLDAEIFQVCQEEAREKGHKLLVVGSANTSMTKLISKFLKPTKSL